MNLARWGVILCVASASWSLTGCANDRARSDGGAAVDASLMAYLSEARALHHQANVREDMGDLPGARAVLQRLVDARTPGPTAPPPEVEEVLADAYARLGELALKQNDLDGAQAAIAKGLEHAPGVSYFRGHLLEVSGLVEEARSHHLADAGKLEEATHARERAITLLEEVVKIQEQVIERSLGGAEAGVTPRKGP